MYICPHDLMKLDITRMKAFNQEPEQCWECQCCVKACPQQAIEVRSFQDWVPMGGAAIPLRTDNAIMWTIKFRDGEGEALQVPGAHQPPVGSIEPDQQAAAGRHQGPAPVHGSRQGLGDD